ncbi:MAG: hypothetical protein ABI036_14675 [Fibrobacteria bacterium]
MAIEALVRALTLASLAAGAASGNLPDTARELAPQERVDDYAKGLVELARAERAWSAHPDSLPLRLDRLRILYVLGIKEEAHLDVADADWKVLFQAERPQDQALLMAYAGALRVARAKHGYNFRRKWDRLKAGLPLLDSAVSLAPEHPEVRYLRLVSNYYLPFFMGRRARVKADFAVLARLLPATRAYPGRWLKNVGRFVLDKGDLGPEEVAALSSHLRGLEGEGG